MLHDIRSEKSHLNSEECTYDLVEYYLLFIIAHHHRSRWLKSEFWKRRKSEKNESKATCPWYTCVHMLNLLRHKSLFFLSLPPHHISHCTSLFNYLPFQSQHLQVSSMLLNFHQYHCSLSSLHLSSHHGNLTSDSKELCKTWHAVFPLIRYWLSFCNT